MKILSYMELISAELPDSLDFHRVTEACRQDIKCFRPLVIQKRDKHSCVSECQTLVEAHFAVLINSTYRVQHLWSPFRLQGGAIFTVAGDIMVDGRENYKHFTGHAITAT